MIPKILIRRRDAFAVPPSKGYSLDAGFDLYCAHDAIVWPKCTIDMEVGWDIKIPWGHWGLLTGRSSAFKNKKLLVVNGIIDPNYTGKGNIHIWNPGFIPRRIKKGERIGQLLIIPLPQIGIKEVNYMPTTERSTKCFGSTGA